MRKYTEDYIKLVERIGKNIKKVRENKGISIDELSQKIGFSKKYLNNLEEGKTLGTTIGRLLIISDILKVKLHTLC
mgnify:CR=1 FL=1